jgi:hypothetical protein
MDKTSFDEKKYGKKRQYLGQTKHNQVCWKTHPNNNSQTNLVDGYNSLIFPNYNKRSQRLETRPLGSNLWILTMENDVLNFLNIFNMLKALSTFFGSKS